MTAWNHGWSEPIRSTLCLDAILRPRFTAPTLERTPPSSIRSSNTAPIDDERRSSLLHSLERLRGAPVLVRATRVRIRRRCADAGRSLLRFIEGRRGVDTRTCRRRAVARFENAKGCMEQRRRTRDVAPVVRGTVRRRRDDRRCERAHVDGFHVRVHAFYVAWKPSFVHLRTAKRFRQERSVFFLSLLSRIARCGALRTRTMRFALVRNSCDVLRRNDSGKGTKAHEEEMTRGRRKMKVVGEEGDVHVPTMSAMGSRRRTKNRRCIAMSVQRNASSTEMKSGFVRGPRTRLLDAT